MKMKMKGNNSEYVLFHGFTLVVLRGSRRAPMTTQYTRLGLLYTPCLGIHESHRSWGK